MAMDAKQSLMSRMERRSADLLTGTELTGVMKILAEVLDGFQVEEKATEQMQDGDDLLDAYIASMQVQGRSSGTIARYVHVIGQCMKFLKIPTRSVNVYHLRNWIAAEKARGIQESTLEGNRQVLSAYFGWLKREGLIERNPVENIGVIKVPKKQKKVFSDTDIEKMNRCCKTLRDRAILHFLRSTGCRISEMTGLERDAVDLAALECVVCGKGNKERTVYLDAVAGMLLEEYLATRTDDNPALFIGKRKERLDPGGVRCMLKKLGERANVEHVHPHKFRRTRATDLTRHGMPIQEVASLLGHEKLDTTMRYVVLNQADIKSNYRRYA